jgi:probable F420-dependent oxidoreductase
MDIGRIGCWTWLDGFSGPEAAAFAQRLEAWGYGALWIPEAVGRDPFSLIGYLAAQTERLVFATGIANIYARDPMTMRAVAQTLGELSDGRFILGLGVSHAPLVEGVRGHEYAKPLTTMRNTLEAIDKALYMGPAPEKKAPIVIAALRAKMLALAAEKCAGAHPYNSPPEHTARAREIMGEGPLLCPDQKAILETDPGKARALGRETLKTYLELPNYQNNWRDLGFCDDDFRDGGSDRLIDAVFAWGDEKAIGDRIQAHLDAGADHVCLQAISAEGGQGPNEKILEIFAPAKNR